MTTCTEVGSAPDPGRCNFFIRKKNHYCRLLTAANEIFCGEHQTVDRVPCPYDHSHTVRSSNLRRHLKVCNAIPKSLPYEEIDVNLGVPEAQCDPAGVVLESTLDISKEEWQWFKNVVETWDLEPVEAFSVESHGLRQELLDAKVDQKHVLQQSSIVSLLQSVGALEPLRCFVEFGAGKGEGIHVLASEVKRSKEQPAYFLAVDRQNFKLKVDRYFKREILEQLDRTDMDLRLPIDDTVLYQSNSATRFRRLRLDIKDLVLERAIAPSNGASVVAFSKHLCGVATDYALRCLDQFPGPKHSVVIALCCHHRCNYQSLFVDKSSNSLTRRVFEYLRKLSSWYLCGWGSTQADETIHGTSLEEAAKIGEKCKRILDSERCRWLRSRDWVEEVKLVRYVDSSVTLENVALVVRCKENPGATCV